MAESSAPTGTGHSQLTDPFGTVVAAYDDSVQVGVHEIDVNAVEKARKALAVLDNERPIRQVSAPSSN